MCPIHLMQMLKYSIWLGVHTPHTHCTVTSFTRWVDMFWEILPSVLQNWVAVVYLLDYIYIFPLQLSSMGGKGFIWCDGTVSKCSHPEANWKQPRAGRHVNFLCFPAGCRAHRQSWRNSTPKQPEKEVSDLRQLGYTQR